MNTPTETSNVARIVAVIGGAGTTPFEASRTLRSLSILAGVVDLAAHLTSTGTLSAEERREVMHAVLRALERAEAPPEEKQPAPFLDTTG